jgi:hypothetical protein
MQLEECLSEGSGKKTVPMTHWQKNRKATNEVCALGKVAASSKIFFLSILTSSIANAESASLLMEILLHTIAEMPKTERLLGEGSAFGRALLT